MSEENQNQTPPANDPVVQSDPQTEKQLLMAQAKVMGLTVSNNITIEKLRERIAEHTAKQPVTSVAASLVADAEVEELGEYAIPSTKSIHVLRKEMRLEAMALVRVRIGNMDPKKAGLQGEIHTLHNDLIGTIKHFVPYGDPTENGWMLPKILVDHLKSKQFQHIRSYTDPKTKQVKVETAMRNEFVIETLPQLTASELADLRAAQLGQ